MREKIFSFSSFVGSTASILGNYNLCHSACMLLISFLSIVGITVVGMPLLFLQSWAPYMWSLGALFLILSVILYLRMNSCISKRAIGINSGLLIAGVPFFKGINPLFWITGGAVVFFNLVLFAKERFNNHRENDCCNAASKTQ